MTTAFWTSTTLNGLADRAETAMPIPFAAPVGTTAATVGTEQTGLAAGERSQGRGPGSAGEKQSRPPAGSPQGGQQHPADWDGTSGTYGDNTRLEVIKQQIYEALKNKKAIALVGGAADRTMNGPIKNIIKYIRQQYPNAKIEYFTNDQDHELREWLKEQGRAYGSDNVAVVGHSWGGDTAAAAVASGAKVGAIITIDPVSLSWFRPDMENVRKNSKTWINVNANPNETMRAMDGKLLGIIGSNDIAGVGDSWDDAPNGHADHHYNANINHTDAGDLLLQ